MGLEDPPISGLARGYLDAHISVDQTADPVQGLSVVTATFLTRISPWTCPIAYQYFH